MSHCENCGCKIYRHGCVNCNEESYIMDQYHELDIPGPSEEFCAIVQEQKIKEKQRRRHLLESTPKATWSVYE